MTVLASGGGGSRWEALPLTPPAAAKGGAVRGPDVASPSSTREDSRVGAKEARHPSNLATPFEKWLHLLKFAEFYRRKDQVLPAELAEEEGIAMALDAMRDALTKEEVLINMALRDKMARDEANSILAAREDGLEQGRKDGLVEGRKEVVRKMLAAGIERTIALKLADLKDEDLA